MTNRDDLAGALIPTLQRVKNVPLGGDLMPHAYAAVDVLLPIIERETERARAESEAKARRFANLLGNQAKYLNDVLPAEFIRQKAEARAELLADLRQRMKKARDELLRDMPDPTASDANLAEVRRLGAVASGVAACIDYLRAYDSNQENRRG